MEQNTMTVGEKAYMVTGHVTSNGVRYPVLNIPMMEDNTWNQLALQQTGDTAHETI